MKAYVAVAIIVLVLAAAPSLWAQACYSPITSWQGSYSLTTSGTFSCLNGEATCTISQSAAGNLNIGSSFASCSVAAWGGDSNSGFTGSVYDTVLSPCDGGGNEGDIFSGPSSGAVSAAGVAVTASSTYGFSGQVGGLGTLTPVNCDGSEGNPTPVGITTGPSSFPTFTLPTNVEALTVVGDSFQAQNLLQVTVPWTFSFTATPTYNDDDDCKDEGGQGDQGDRGGQVDPPIPVGSSIGCLNQSLGEDVAVVGTRFVLHYESGRASGAPGDAIASADAAMIGGWTLSVHHAYDPNTSTLFLGDGTQRNGYQLGTPVSDNGNLLLTSEDGSEVYVFTSAGQHLQTLRPLTGALKYQFGYDSAGELITVTDATGNVTTIQRTGSEQATAIVSPYGQTTMLGMDGNGFLSQVTDPLGKSSTFVNSTTGLLSSRSDSNGNSFSYTYDGNGRLTKDADPLGGYVMASRSNSNTGFGYTVMQTTSMNRTTSYQNTLTLPWLQNGTSPESHQRTVTWPDGLVATSSKNFQSSQLTDNYSLPDGTTVSKTLAPDPVWGLQVPVETSETVTMGNLSTSIAGSRSITLGTAGNPFSVTTETDTQTMNGRTYTSTFTGSSRTWLNKSPVGRTLSVVLDPLERVSSTKLGALTATVLTYDSHGRIATSTQGTRKTTFSYGSNGFLAGVTNPLNSTTSYSYDADGHLSTTTFPDGRVIGYTYDGNGNLTSITPPGKLAHDFVYSAVDLMSTYTPPTVTGTGATTYSYNLDRDLTQIIRPGGGSIEYGYDSAGRLSSVTTPTESIAYAFDSNTGNVTSASISGGETLAYSYNGPLLISSALTGIVSGTVSRSYDDNFWVSSESLNGSSTIKFSYDNDGFVTKAGSLVVRLNPKDGLITGTTLGTLTDTRTYNTFGELTGVTDKHKTTVLYAASYTRDAGGRISAKTETIEGIKNDYAYTFDVAGRLTAVTKNGSSLSSYTYDSNSNRLTMTSSSGTATGTYDAQDRLLAYGNASFTYTAAGELASQTTGSQTTNYTYDASGNLISVTLPNGKQITYVIDPEDHRVGKLVSGMLQSGYLYDQDGWLVAQLNGSNQIISQFVYGTGSTAPDYMISDGVVYRIFSDPLGSPLLVVDTSTEAIAEQISYDEFGNVLSDTNPGFQPFGFAGGLYDQDTKLVRFGARDYNPSIGRWTAKDPIKFDGGDPNLYGYVLQDPINLADPSGLGGSCKWIKKKVKEAVKQKASNIPVVKEPGIEVDVHTDKPGVSGTVGVTVEVDGQTVGGVNGTVDVGVTPTSNPRAPIIYVDGSGNVVVLGHTIWHGQVHKEVGDPNDMPTVKDLDKEKNKADGVTCTDPTDHCTGTPYTAP